jgi:hypothetical protein
MPRRKKKSQAYVWGDTPEIQALGAGFARQEYFMNGYGEAQGEANKFAIRSTAVPKDVKPQIAYLTPQYGKYGIAGGKFLQPITEPKVLEITGLTTSHYLGKAFLEGRTKLGADQGYVHSLLQGPTSSIELFRAFRT